jgi:signal transduction histidine kinase
MGIVILFVSLLGLIVIMETRSHMKHVLSEQLEKRGGAIASDVAARSTNLMLVGDTFSLFEIARGLSSHYEDVRYLLIFDKNGQLVVHSFKEGIPNGLLDVRSIPADPLSNHTLTLKSEEGEIQDILVPIAEGKVGWLRLGMSEISLYRSIDQLSQLLLIRTIVISLFGLFGALIISHLVTKPIRDLATASQGIARGDYSQRVSTLGADEITNLGIAFNLMASSIERYTKEREALVGELKDKEAVRQELLKKVISAQEDERKRISRELHDETSQSLTSLIIGLKLLSELDAPAKSPNMALELKDLASSTLQEVHRLAVELRPTVLDDMGLIPAVERFVNSFTRQYNIDVDLHVQNKLKKRLPGEIEITLYRIIQEALTNVAKYAEAFNASILLELKHDYANLIIEDDGWGFDADQTLESTLRDNHLGIAGMKERTALLRGEFTIESSPGQGTTVYVRIPVVWRDEDTPTNQATPRR